MKIKTVITTTFYMTKEQFESKRFQESLNDIRTGKMRREFMDSAGDGVVDATVTYWTDYKQKTK